MIDTFFRSSIPLLNAFFVAVMILQRSHVIPYFDVNVFFAHATLNRSRHQQYLMTQLHLDQCYDEINKTNNPFTALVGWFWRK